MCNLLSLRIGLALSALDPSRALCTEAPDLNRVVVSRGGGGSRRRWDAPPSPGKAASAQFVPAQLPYKVGSAPVRVSPAPRELLRLFTRPAATAHARPAPDSGAPSFSASWWSNPHTALSSQRGKAKGLWALGTRRVLIPGKRQGSRGTDATIPCLSVSRVCRHHLKA